MSLLDLPVSPLFPGCLLFGLQFGQENTGGTEGLLHAAACQLVGHQRLIDLPEPPFRLRYALGQSTIWVSASAVSRLRLATMRPTSSRAAIAWRSASRAR